VNLYSYRLFGATLLSDLPFPELIPAQTEKFNREKCILIRSRNTKIAHLKDSFTRLRGFTYWFDPPYRYATIHTPLAGNFLVDLYNRSIHWNSSQKSSLPYVRFVLKGEVLNFLLPYLEPSFLLHSNMLVHEGEGIGFSGSTGQGKSTLTAFLLSNGFSILGDETALIHRRGKRFFVESGAPEIRLWPQAAQRLTLLGRVRGEPVFPGAKKLRFCLNSHTPWHHVEKRVPLRALYFISRRKGGNVKIENLKGRGALSTLVEQGCNPAVKDPRIFRQQFEMAVDLVQKVPIRRLVYPSGFSHLPKVRRTILKDLSGL